MIRLPISGVRTQWRSVDGHDEIAVADSSGGLAGALVCAARCAVGADAQPLQWAHLPVGDLDAIIVARRAALRGDSFVAEGTCRSCAAPVDIQFSLEDYRCHHAPVPRRGALPIGGGWWRLGAAHMSVRVPSVSDVLAALEAPDPRSELLARCARDDDGAAVSGARRAATAQRALAVLGPTLHGEVQGRCPECGTDVVLDVDLRELCLTELRFLAQSVYEDVHLIASAYGWTQEVALDMSSHRRRRYADLIAGRRAYIVDEEVVSVG